MGKTNTVKKQQAKKSSVVKLPDPNQPVNERETKREHIEIDMAKYVDHKTTAAKIRAMAVDNIPRALIAKVLGIRYQHVRNVLTQPLKRVQS
jgi:hypothetical protein